MLSIKNASAPMAALLLAGALAAPAAQDRPGQRMSEAGCIGWVHINARKGQAAACQLGLMHDEGNGLPQDGNKRCIGWSCRASRATAWLAKR